MKEFKCSGCNAGCIVKVPTKSKYSGKKIPTECIYGIISLETDNSISVWKESANKE